VTDTYSGQAPPEAHEQVARAMRLLEAMATGMVGALDPVPEPCSPCAYTYPAAADMFGTKPGGEVSTLEALAAQHILSVHEVATVPVCPYCRTYQLKVEPYCPTCGGSALRQAEVWRHRKCGFVGPEDQYRSGDMTCPGCGRKVKTGLKDVEPQGQAWVCSADGTVMHQPEMRYESVTCGRKVAIGEAVSRPIYSYRLEGEGRMIATEQNVAAALEGALRTDSLTGLPGAIVIARAIELEQEKAHRYGSTFTVLRIGVANGSELRQQFGEDAVSGVVRTLASVVRENLRVVDLLGREDAYNLLLVMPGTEIAGATVLLDRLGSTAAALMHAEDADPAHRAATISARAFEPGELG
jgi:diguanylate cyclase (GGDEF)-like protein